MNKFFIAFVFLSLAFIVTCMVLYIPTIWLVITALYIFCAVSFYLQLQLKRRTVEELQKCNNKFVASGNAITDTLKSAFDSIKKNTQSVAKLQSAIADHKNRIRRIEQQLSRVTVRGIPLADAVENVKDAKSNSIEFNKQLLAQKREQRNEQRNHKAD
jgi:CRISPR/Cas system-associated exonuclease Cas4 (RecB family)